MLKVAGHTYVWQFNRETQREAMLAITAAAADESTPITWAHAAELTSAIRDMEWATTAHEAG